MNPSDEVANGDVKEDLEVEDERDDADMVVQDHGFAARSSWTSAVQLNSNIIAAPAKKSTKKAAPSYSEELANGDSADDKELENERDGDDTIVSDNGFAVR